jgi:hypothetical protein
VRAALPAGVLLAAFALAGCGGSSAPPTITVGAARVFRLGGFQPAEAAKAGVPTTVSFRIVQPDGKPLTAYRHGAGPHNGIHLILVRSDLGAIIHRHPPVQRNGTISEQVVFPTPGRWRVVVDAYPQTSGPQRNFQLFTWIRVAGTAPPPPKPQLKSTVTVDGYTITLHGKPRLRAIQPAFLHFTVRSPSGAPAQFTPWYGALAHAIFFRRGTLDYFHTHVCSAGAAGCTSVLGGAKVTGRSGGTGTLDVGVLVPVPGTWRLFLQCDVGGRVLTAPFTLTVH